MDVKAESDDMNKYWPKYQERYRQEPIRVPGFPGGRIGRVSLVRRNGSVAVRWREDDGSQRWKTIGGFGDGDVLTEAINYALKVNQRLEAPVFQKATIREARDMFLELKEAVTDLRGATICKYRQELDRVLQFAERAKEGKRCRFLNQVDSRWCQDFGKWLDDLRCTRNGCRATTRNCERPLSRKQKRGIKERLRSVLEHAQSRMPPLVPPDVRNPMTRELIGGKGRRGNMLTNPPVLLDELAGIVGVLDGYALGLLAPLFLYGPRPSELGRILRVDYDDCLLTMRSRPETGYTTKGDVDKFWSVTDALRACLRPFLAGAAGPLFVRRDIHKGKARPLLANADETTLVRTFESRLRREAAELGRPLRKEEVDKISEGVWAAAGAVNARNVRRELERAARKAGLKRLPKPKDCRHLFVCQCLEAGIPSAVKRFLMGHHLLSGELSLGMFPTSSVAPPAEGAIVNYEHVWAALIRDQVARLDERRRPLIEALVRRADELAS